MSPLPVWRAAGGARALPWALAVTALLGAAALALGLTPRWQADAAAAEQAVQALARRAAARPAAPAATPAPDDAQRLLQALAPAAEAPARVAALLALARRHGLVVDSTRQAWAPPAAAAALPLQRLQLVIGARGGYIGLRSFVAEALQHDDTLLLDQLRLSRARPDAAELGAELHWSLLLRADGGGAR